MSLASVKRKEREEMEINRQLEENEETWQRAADTIAIQAENEYEAIKIVEQEDGADPWADIRSGKIEVVQSVSASLQSRNKELAESEPSTKGFEIERKGIGTVGWVIGLVIFFGVVYIFIVGIAHVAAPECPKGEALYEGNCYPGGWALPLQEGQ